MLIPEDTISFTDTTPYHDIPMYKTLLRFHLGIMSRVVTQTVIKEKMERIKVKQQKTAEEVQELRQLEVEFNKNQGEFVKGSFSFLQRRTETYKNIENDLIITNDSLHSLPEKDIRFRQYIFERCFFVACQHRNIVCFLSQQSLFISFNVGVRPTFDFRTLKGMIDKDIFTNFLQFIKHICDTNTVSQIILQGHSNGGAASTITAFILQSIFDPVYKEKNRILIPESWDDYIERWRRDYKELNKSMFVVSTGAFPLLFSTQEQFIMFYNQLKGRYVSVISGFLFQINGKNAFYLDYFGSPIYDLHNYKYAIYYGKLDNYYNDVNDKIMNEKVGFYGVIVNPDYTIPKDWVANRVDGRLILTDANHPKSIIMQPGLAYPDQMSIPHPFDVDASMFLHDFEPNGNKFLNCEYEEKYYQFNRPGIKTCEKYQFNPHVLEFYRYILSIYLFGEEDVAERERQREAALERERQRVAALEREREREALERERQAELDRQIERLAELERDKRESLARGSFDIDFNVDSLSFWPFGVKKSMAKSKSKSNKKKTMKTKKRNVKQRKSMKTKFSRF